MTTKAQRETGRKLDNQLGSALLSGFNADGEKFDWQGGFRQGICRGLIDAYRALDLIDSDQWVSLSIFDCFKDSLPIAGQDLFTVREIFI